MEESRPRGNKDPKTSKAFKGPKVVERKKVPGVIYVGHLPWGFEEKGLRAYFSQFGTVKELRLARSRKTLNSKGYAFVRFAHDEVAKIAADSMDNYLMFGKLLKCKHIKDVHPFTFLKRPSKTKWEKALVKEVKKQAKQTKNSTVDKDVAVLKRYKKKMKKIKQLNIDYTIEELENQLNERRAKLNEKKEESESEDEGDGKDVEMDSKEESDSDEDLKALNGIYDEDSDDDDDDDSDQDVKSKSIKHRKLVSKSLNKEKTTLDESLLNTPLGSKKLGKANKGTKRESDDLDGKVSSKTPLSTPKNLLSSGKIKLSKKEQTPKPQKDTFDGTSSLKKHKKVKKATSANVDENIGFITPQNRKVTTSLVTASKSTPSGTKRKHTLEDGRIQAKKSGKKRYFGDFSASIDVTEKVGKKKTEVSAGSPQTVKKQKQVDDGIETKSNRGKNTPLNLNKEKNVGSNENGKKTPGFSKLEGIKLSRKQSLGTPRLKERIKTPSRGNRKKSL